MRFHSLCVLGLGYIGLPTASTFATNGLQVIGVDVNRRIVDILRNGEIHIQEPGLRDLVQAAFGSGNLRVAEQPEPADAFLIAVPTPIQLDKRADLTAVRAAARAIAPALRPGNLVVLEIHLAAADDGRRRGADPGRIRPGAGPGFLAGLLARAGAARADPARAGRERAGRRGSQPRFGRSRARAVLGLRARRNRADRRHDGRDGQVDGEHLPRRQHRRGQRVRRAGGALRRRCLGGDRTGQPSPARRRAASRAGGRRPLYQRRSVVPGRVGAGTDGPDPTGPAGE